MIGHLPEAYGPEVPRKVHPRGPEGVPTAQEADRSVKQEQLGALTERPSSSAPHPGSPAVGNRLGLGPAPCLAPQITPGLWRSGSPLGMLLEKDADHDEC